MVTPEEHEVKDEKYFEDLLEYFDAYVKVVINEIFVGIGVSLGLPEKEAYKLAKTDPKKLEKANFFSNIFEKFKNIFKHKVPKFRIKQNIFNNGKPLSEQQWAVINKSISDYWKKQTQPVVEDATVKAYVLGIKTAKMRRDGKPQTGKSLIEILKKEKEEKGEDFSSKFEEAYRSYDFKNSEKNAMNKAFSNIAMYVSETETDVREAIRKNITEGINEGKSPTEVASDLYWNVQKETGQKTAESVRKNWSRIAATEMNNIFEAGILAPEEARAMESLKNPEKAVYFIRTGGTCDWCVPRQGTLVRLVPSSIVPGDTDSLKAMGIDDPNTDIAIWIGKNNIGRKKADWWICCPAHPWNRASFSPIDLKTQEYDKKLGRVVDKVPESLRRYGIKDDRSFTTPEYKESKKPKKIGDNLVRFYDSVYEAVEPEDIKRKDELWKKDPSLPIPISKNTNQYKRIFGNAE